MFFENDDDCDDNDDTCSSIPLLRLQFHLHLQRKLPSNQQSQQNNRWQIFPNNAQVVHLDDDDDDIKYDDDDDDDDDNWYEYEYDDDDDVVDDEYDEYTDDDGDNLYYKYHE